MRKFRLEEFQFLKLLGKGSFGKVGGTGWERGVASERWGGGEGSFEKVLGGSCN